MLLKLKFGASILQVHNRDNSVRKSFTKSLAMENLDFQLNLTMIQNAEFEEKVDIDDLVLPSKPMKSTNIEINEIKQERLEEEKKHSFDSDCDKGKKFEQKMEDNILHLCEELDKEKSENSAMDFSLRRSGNLLKKPLMTK